MEPIVFATWGLVVATALLAVAGWLQWLQGKRGAETQRQRAEEELRVLRDQANALSDEADASRRVAEEMLAARRAANPLDLDLEERDALANQASFRLRSLGGGAVVERVEGLLGAQREVVWSNEYGNAYLGGDMTMGVQETYPADRGDLLVIQVTGTPTNGVSQSFEFQFRIDRERHLQPIDPQGTLVSVRLSSAPHEGSLVITVVNSERRPVQINRAGFGSDRSASPTSLGPIRSWREHYTPWPPMMISSGGSATEPAPPPPLPATLQPGGSIEVAAYVDSIARNVPAASWAFVEDARGLIHWARLSDVVQREIQRHASEIASAAQRRTASN